MMTTMFVVRQTTSRRKIDKVSEQLNYDLANHINRRLARLCVASSFESLTIGVHFKDSY